MNNSINHTPEIIRDSLGDVISYETAQDVVDPLRLQGFETQYPTLNLMGGIKLKSFTVIAAEQGVGKSLFALGLILHQANKNVKSGYFDLENGAALTVERLIRIKYQVDKKTILAFSADEVLDHVKRMANLTYYSPSKIQELVAEVKAHDKNASVKQVILSKIRTKAGYGVKIFVLDPFSRICENESDTELHDEGKLAGELADLASELNIAIIAVHHMRKGNRTKYIKEESEIEDTSYVMPSLESIRGSSKIVDRATDVWGLIRFRSQEEDEADKAILAVLKNRTGLTRNVKLEFDKDTLTFLRYTPTLIDRIFDKSAH